MKLDVAVNDIVLSNVKSTGEFKIRNSAKAFSILSSGLYSNKIKAIIRELSCNAVDSHVAAGNTSPFDVHLPSMLEPWFSVRDYGTGLDDNQVTNIYTTYFESTKTDSNDFIGALGLGSKSPFSYTENFTVTAIKDGMQRIYSAFINEMGVPSIACMSTELTDEPNGVEVKFSVTERYDYNSFRHEAAEVFKWFKNKPNVLGVHFTHETPTYKEENIVPGVHVRSYETSSTALMGNIAYPLSSISEPEKHFGDLSSLLNCGLVIEFGIGELDFAASREVLSFIPVTINSIKRKLEELNANLVKHFAAKADAITCEWARAQLLYTESQSALYRSAVKKYATDTKFPLYDATAYYGKKTFELLTPDLEKDGLSIKAFQSYNGSFRGKIGAGWAKQLNAAGQHIATVNIPVDTSVVFVLNDLKTGCEARARYHYVTCNRKQVSVFCVSHTSDDLAVRQAAYDTLMKELHNPPTIVLASTLEKRESVKRTPLSNVGIAALVPKVSKSSSYGYRYGRQDTEYKWEPHREKLDDKTLYYYVCLNGHQPEHPDGTQFNVQSLRSSMDSCGVANIKDIKIFGVRKNRIKELKGRKNWIWIEDKLKEETAKVSDADIVTLVAYDELDHYSYRAYTNESIAKLAGKTSDYAKFVKEYGAIARSTGNVAELTTLCGKYGKSVQVNDVKKKITTARDLVVAKYPLIQHCSNASEKMIADYVKLIDRLDTNI